MVDRTDYCSFVYLAAENGFVEVAKFLLSANADVNQQNFEGNTPLFIASKNGHIQMIQLLLQQPEIAIDLVNDSGESPLSIATANKFGDVTQLLSSAKATIGVHQNAPPRSQRLQVKKKTKKKVKSFRFSQ